MASVMLIAGGSRGIGAATARLAVQRGYKVVLYADGNNGGDARAAQYWLQNFAGSVTNSAGTDLTSHFALLDAANTDFAGTYTQVTSTNTAAPSAGNYIIFDGLTAGSFVLRADELSGGTLRAPINAIQIILNPPAAATTEWINPGSGQWYVSSNWSGGVPNGTMDARQQQAALFHGFSHAEARGVLLWACVRF